MPRAHDTNPNPWSEEELVCLREAYTTWPPRYDLLPSRPRGAIQTKATRLGLTRGRQVGPLFTDIPPVEWAYLAGIVDGEGTIGSWTPQGRQKSNRRVIIVNTYKPLIDWIAERFPGGVVHAYHLERRKPLWQVLYIRGAVIVELLTGLLPYLRVKADVARALLEEIASDTG